MSFFIWGDHSVAAYSRCGRIMVVKRFRKLSLFRSVNDLLMAPIIRLALLTCSIMCMLKLSLSSNMTPRSFSWLTILSGSCQVTLIRICLGGRIAAIFLSIDVVPQGLVGIYLGHRMKLAD